MHINNIAALLLVVGEAQPPKAATSKCAANLILEIFKNAKRGQFIFV